MLAAAERPLLWIGGAVHPADVADVAKLAESWMLPVMPTHRRPHLFDPAHPNYGGYMSGRLPSEQMAEVQTTDLLVALGERLTVSTTQGFTFPAAPEPQVPLVHVWPGPEEVGRVLRPDLAMACEPAAVVRALLARGAPAGAARRRGWVERLHARTTRSRSRNGSRPTDGVNFTAVVAAVGRHLDARRDRDDRRRQFLDLRAALSADQAGADVPELGGRRDGRRHADGGRRLLRRPGTQVIGFAGDGGALMTGNELATARQYGVNPVFVISDNGCYGTITQHHDLRYPGRPYLAATQLTNPDFALWATAFGAKGFTIRDESRGRGHDRRGARDGHQPVVVHVHSSLQQINAWRRRG